MGKRLVLLGVVCNDCLKEDAVNPGLIHHEDLLDGSYVRYCDRGHIDHKQYLLYYLEGKKKIGCVIKFEGLFDIYKRPVFKRHNCWNLHVADDEGEYYPLNFQCEKCPYLKRGKYKSSRKFVYKKLLKRVDGEIAEGLDHSKLFHRHSGFGTHPISRKHKRQKDKPDKRFYDFDEFLKWMKWIKGIKPLAEVKY